jgi:hypothetical protein
VLENPLRAPAVFGFGSFTVHQVEPGTVVTDEHTGREVLVTDEAAALKGRDLYLTPTTLAAMLEQPAVARRAAEPGVVREVAGG